MTSGSHHDPYDKYYSSYRPSTTTSTGTGASTYVSPIYVTPSGYITSSGTVESVETKNVDEDYDDIAVPGESVAFGIRLEPEEVVSVSCCFCGVSFAAKVMATTERQGSTLTVSLSRLERTCECPDFAIVQWDKQ